METQKNAIEGQGRRSFLSSDFCIRTFIRMKTDEGGACSRPRQYIPVCSSNCTFLVGEATQGRSACHT